METGGRCNSMSAAIYQWEYILTSDSPYSTCTSAGSPSLLENDQALQPISTATEKVAEDLKSQATKKKRNNRR